MQEHLQLDEESFIFLILPMEDPCPLLFQKAISLPAIYLLQQNFQDLGSFIDSGGKHKTPESETIGITTHSIASGKNLMFATVLLPSQSPPRSMERGLTWTCHNWETLSLGKSLYFKEATSKPDQSCHSTGHYRNFIQEEICLLSLKEKWSLFLWLNDIKTIVKVT